MADEWYLMNTEPNRYSGFDDDDFNSFAIEGFDEMQNSFVGTEVILCNHDLSDTRIIRCIIQGNIADTHLKSLERTLLLPIGTVKAGMYMYFDDKYWLVTGYPGNNKIYEKVTVVLCQYKLRWQKSDGTVLERWCNLTSAAKYDIGESGNNALTLATNNYVILIPNDEDSMTIESKRIFIDKNNTDPKKVFKITRNDDSFYDYGKLGGILSLVADRQEFNEEKDNKELMICDYISPALSPSTSEGLDENDIRLSIAPMADVVKLGGQYVTFKGSIKDSADVTGSWDIICNFDPSKIVKVIKNNQIKIKIPIDCYELIGKAFELRFGVGNDSVSKTLTINDYL